VVQSNTVVNGAPFLTLLTILFIGLKLTGYVDWSWWLVLLPLWGVFALAFVIFLVGALFIGSSKVFS
jgi:hypothetical protein